MLSAKNVFKQSNAIIRRHGADGIIVAFLGFLVILFFWNAIFLQGVFFHEDILAMNYPMRLYVANLLRQHILPLWNPYIFLGFPLLAEGQMGAFYPLNWALFLTLPSPIAFNYSTVLHFFLAGAFTYGYGRALGMWRIGSLVAGLSFMFSAVLVFQLSHTNLLNGATWLPLILLCCEKAVQRENLLWAIMAGFTVGMQFLAGTHPYSIYMLLLVFVYFGFHLAFAVQQDRGRKRVGFLLVCLLVTCGVGFGLAAIQLVPTFELISLSDRGGGKGLKFALTGSLFPAFLINLLVPYFYGNVATGSYFLDRGLAWEYGGYIGILPLIFAAMAVVFDRNRYVILFGSWALLAVLLALGGYSPLWFLYRIPGADYFREPARILLVYTFAMAVLAGFGCSYLAKLHGTIDAKIRKRLKRFCWIGMLVGSIALVGACVLYVGKPYFVSVGATMVKTLDRLIPPGHASDAYISRLGHPMATDFYLYRIEKAYPVMLKGLASFLSFLFSSTLLLILFLKKHFNLYLLASLVVMVTVSDLFLFGAQYNPVITPEIYISKPSTTLSMAGEESLYRISHFQTLSSRIVHQSGYPNVVLTQEFNLLRRKQLVANINMLDEIPSFDGLTPLYLKSYVKLYKIIRQGPDRTLDNVLANTMEKRNLLHYLNLLSMLNVKYILTGGELDNAGLRLVYRDSDGIRIYRNEDAMPRAFVVHAARVVENHERAFAVLQDAAFDPQAYVILEKAPGIPLPARSNGQTQTTTAEILRYTPNEVVVRVALERPGILVLSDTYYPGWIVQVDGTKQELYRANYIVRGVCLDSGEHTVRFAYQPRSFQIGASLSVLTLLSAGTLGLFAGYRRAHAMPKGG